MVIMLPSDTVCDRSLYCQQRVADKFTMAIMLYLDHAIVHRHVHLVPKKHQELQSWYTFMNLLLWLHPYAILKTISIQLV